MNVLIPKIKNVIDNNNGEPMISFADERKVNAFDRHWEHAVNRIYWQGWPKPPAAVNRILIKNQKN